MSHRHVLATRLGNCVRTILGLESEIEAVDLGVLLQQEFHSLRTFLSRIDACELDEADVARIEAATECFLNELRAVVRRKTPVEAQPHTGPMQ